MDTDRKRDYVIETINRFKTHQGRVLIDVNRELNLFGRELKNYMEKNVRIPLSVEFRNSYLEGYGSFGYALFSGGLKDKSTYSFIVEENILSEGLLPPRLECGLKRTIEKQLENNSDFEFILFVKAFDTEDQIFPEDIFHEELSLSGR